MTRVTKTELKAMAGACPACGGSADSVDVEATGEVNAHGAKLYEGTSSDKEGHQWPFRRYLGAEEIENPAVHGEGNVSAEAQAGLETV